MSTVLTAILINSFFGLTTKSIATCMLVNNILYYYTLFIKENCWQSVCDSWIENIKNNKDIFTICFRTFFKIKWLFIWANLNFFVQVCVTQSLLEIACVVHQRYLCSFAICRYYSPWNRVRSFIQLSFVPRWVKLIQLFCFWKNKKINMYTVNNQKENDRQRTNVD